MVIVGVDEAGRGCLAGDVVAAAVVLPVGFVLDGLTDSKKISTNKRELLYAQIISNCQYAIGQASPVEIDEINILQATMLAMRRAVVNLGIDYDKVLVDGNKCPDISNCVAIVGGDLSEAVISTASIVAKVYRDRQMLLLDSKYPQYGFAKHNAYPTKYHYRALARYGVIGAIHRLSFNLIK